MWTSSSAGEEEPMMDDEDSVGAVAVLLVYESCAVVAVEKGFFVGGKAVDLLYLGARG